MESIPLRSETEHRNLINRYEQYMGPYRWDHPQKSKHVRSNQWSKQRDTSFFSQAGKESDVTKYNGYNFSSKLAD